MCELMALSFSNPVRASISLNVFQENGIENPDGWGVAYYHEDAMQLIKEPLPASDSILYDFVERSAFSKNYISHLRRSTEGIRSYFNTHPFYRVVNMKGRRFEYCFAHNGTVIDYANLSLGNYTPLGETDSEHVFCHLLDILSNTPSPTWKKTEYQELERLLQSINSPENTLNCILSDGTNLFCYSDRYDHNSGLRYSEYDTAIKLEDQKRDLGEIKVQTTSTSKEAVDMKGVIVTTRAMRKGNWFEFVPGELVVFRDGAIVYASTRTFNREST
ncbi:MAG: class II glutamine amidotransferase [Candidatus Thorarchaeota archaeon]